MGKRGSRGRVADSVYETELRLPMDLGLYVQFQNSKAARLLEVAGLLVLAIR